jgi:ATP-dependent 26S proteasome regulatory subunit
MSEVREFAMLFELLNQMEGLAEDADLVFLLTSNRPDVVEPALAARPGRIDLALEIPLPDEGPAVPPMPEMLRAIEAAGLPFQFPPAE